MRDILFRNQCVYIVGILSFYDFGGCRVKRLEMLVLIKIWHLSVVLIEPREVALVFYWVIC